MKKNLRRAALRGHTAGELPLAQAYEGYLLVERERGATVSSSALPLLPGSPSVGDHFATGVWDDTGHLIAMTYWVKTAHSAKVFLSVGSTRDDGARWLCFAEFLRQAEEKGITHVVIDTRGDLSPGLIHFQNMYGFQTHTVWLRTLPSPHH